MQTRNLLLKAYDPCTFMKKNLKFLFFLFSVSYAIIEAHIFFLSFFNYPNSNLSPCPTYCYISKWRYYTVFSLRCVGQSPPYFKIKSEASIVFKYFCLEKLHELRVLEHFILLKFSVCISNLHQKQITVLAIIPGGLWSAALYSEQS